MNDLEFNYWSGSWCFKTSLVCNSLNIKVTYFMLNHNHYNIYTYVLEYLISGHNQIYDLFYITVTGREQGECESTQWWLIWDEFTTDG